MFVAAPRMKRARNTAEMGISGIGEGRPPSWAPVGG